MKIIEVVLLIIYTLIVFYSGLEYGKRRESLKNSSVIVEYMTGDKRQGLGIWSTAVYNDNIKHLRN